MEGDKMTIIDDFIDSQTNEDPTHSIKKDIVITEYCPDDFGYAMDADECDMCGKSLDERKQCWEKEL
jgi:hypothetical protein